MLPGALLRIDEVLRGPLWAMLCQVPVAGVATYLALATQVEERPAGRRLWLLIAQIALGATLVFNVVLWVVPGLVGLAVAAVAMYVFVMVALDRLLRIHIEHAHSVTSSLCIGTWLAWLVVASVVRIVGAL